MSLRSQAEALFQELSRRSLRIVTVESCTAGLVADSLASIPGASTVLWGGYVCYTVDAKVKMVGIDPALIRVHGPVSQEVALALCDGASERSGADVAVSITGLAGPDGDGTDTPVGTVWIGLKVRGKPSTARVFLFQGNRAEIRQAAAEGAMGQVLATLA